MSDLVFKHDASRIVQSALKYADKTTRATITTELKGSYVALAQSKFLSASFTFPLILSRLAASIAAVLIRRWD